VPAARMLALPAASSDMSARSAVDMSPDGHTYLFRSHKCPFFKITTEPDDVTHSRKNLMSNVAGSAEVRHSLAQERRAHLLDVNLDVVAHILHCPNPVAQKRGDQWRCCSPVTAHVFHTDITRTQGCHARVILTPQHGGYLPSLLTRLVSI
jgi:hypothetical protein